MVKVTVLAPAKLNLALAVGALRADGYHMVDMVMQAVDIYERVEIAKSTGYSLRLPGSPVAADGRNTATKAAAAFFRETGLLAGADITVHKNVPTRAGLGGGSADAAAVLAGLNELYGARLTQAELCAVGAGVGADVPFAIVGGTARVSGIGEVLRPLPPLPGCVFVVAMPRGGGVATPAAYRRFDEQGSPLRPDIDAACRAIAGGDLAALAPHVQNMLEHANGDAATAGLRRVMDGSGALCSGMTGSGAAVFGMFTSAAAADAAARAARGMASQVFTARPARGGPLVI